MLAQQRYCWIQLLDMLDRFLLIGLAAAEEAGVLHLSIHDGSSAKLEKNGSTWFAKKGKSPTQLEVGVDSAQPASRFLQKLSHRLAKLMWINSELSPR